MEDNKKEECLKEMVKDLSKTRKQKWEEYERKKIEEIQIVKKNQEMPIAKPGFKVEGYTPLEQLMDQLALGRKN